MRHRRQSIVIQREFAERYCALHQLQIATIYADDGVSGTLPLDQRPAGARILPDARPAPLGGSKVQARSEVDRDFHLGAASHSPSMAHCGTEVNE